MDWNKVYYKICNDAKSKGRKKSDKTLYHAHHIIPHCFGGTGRTDHGVDLSDPNIVLLTPREHYFCHLLLCKMHENDDNKQNYYKMLSALNILVNCHKDYIDPFVISSREYQKQYESYLKLNIETQGKKVICLNNLKIYPSINNAAKQLNLKIKNHISQVCRGLGLAYNGYTFMWYDPTKSDEFYKKEFFKRKSLAKGRHKISDATF